MKHRAPFLLLLPALAASVLAAREEAPAIAGNAAATVYVLDFNNETRPAAGSLSQLAARSLAARLERTGTRRVVSESRRQAAAEALRLAAPYDRVDRVQLARHLGASQVWYGSVQSAQLFVGPDVRARVRLRVLEEAADRGFETDAATLKGQVVEGWSAATPHQAPDRSTLLSEAIDNAMAQVQ
jgi:hypothetical protein